MTKLAFALIASALALIGNIPYLVSVIRRKTIPHAYTWFVWSIISCIVFFGQLAKGAGVGAIPTAVAEIFTVLIFFVSLRDGFRHVRRIDTIFLVIALMGLIPWVLTKDPTLSVIIAVSIDAVAFIPTLRKTWFAPASERAILYQSNVARHALMLASLQAYNVATMLHSLAMIVTNTTITYFILRKKKTP